MFAILSIDAIKSDVCWDWNYWVRVGEIPPEEFELLTSDRKSIRYFRDNGYLSDYSKGRVAIEDDGYNLVVVSKSTRQPLFAICYSE